MTKDYTTEHGTTEVDHAHTQLSNSIKFRFTKSKL